MVNNKEIVKFIFGESKVIENNMPASNEFLKQILNADTENFILDVTPTIGSLYVWKKGTWRNGIWKRGIWRNGVWENGIWKHGIWNRGKWLDGTWEDGMWRNGTWYNGKWKDGTWGKGRWIQGEIWYPEKRKYMKSEVPPHKCEWSLSYGK